MPRQSLEQKIAAATPDGVCSMLEEGIRKVHGDAVENTCEVYAKAGYYFVRFVVNARQYTKTLRRKQVPEYLRSLKRERGQ